MKINKEVEEKIVKEIEEILERYGIDSGEELDGILDEVGKSW